MSWITDKLQAIWHWLAEAAQWLIDWLFALPKFAFAELLDGVLAVLTAIIPADLADRVAVVGDLPGYMLYFLAPFQVGSGLSIILGAYAIRFVIRRLPFVG